MARLLKVNYDELAPTYDHRYQEDGPTGTANALLNLCAQIRTGRVLEVACGTGHWLEEISRGYPDIHLTGLDRSAGMLAQAHRRLPQFRLLHARAEDLPLPDLSFDLVFCVNAFHHFDDKQEFIREAHRILRPGGRLAVIGSDPRREQDLWYVYQYFPETYAMDLQRFPNWNAIADWMQQAGFASPRLEEIEVIRRSLYGDQVWEDPFLEKHSCSQLTLLSQEEYEAGRGRIREALDQAGPDRQKFLFQANIYMRMLSAEVVEE